MTCKHGFEWCRGTGPQRNKRRPCTHCISDLEAEIERLQVIVDRLPKDADGKPCLQLRSEPVWRKDGPEGRPQASTFFQNELAIFRGGTREEFLPICDCYATQDAAEKARER